MNSGILVGDTGHIAGQGGIMLAVTVAQVCCATAAVFLGARVSMDLGRDLRGAVFATVQGFSAREVNRFGTSFLITARPTTCSRCNCSSSSP